MSRFCSNCGSELKEEQDLCLNCGAIVKNQINKNNGNKKKTSGLSIAGFVIAIICFIFSWIPLVFLGGIVSLILSIIGLLKANSTQDSKGLSIAGIVFSIFSILISSFISFIFFFIILWEIEEDVVNAACVEKYGSRYEAVEGYDFNGYDDEWYCCLKNSNRNYGNCKRIDY